MASIPTSDDSVGQIRTQWSNPGDILSLLLLVGGEVIQKALAQFIGSEILSLPVGHTRIRLSAAPIAFSFGWVAYAFSSLMAAFGEGRLMPADPDYPSIVINCSNAYVRTNRSWVLSRILRDHTVRNEVDPKEVSLRIDLFQADVNPRPDIDKKWLLGWVFILVQHGLAVVPWKLYGYWPIFMITACGTFLALVTSAIPQWNTEKWAGRPLEPGKKKVVGLTRGNGHHHIMVIVGDGQGWDLEAMASATSVPHFETRWIVLILCFCWTLLLITVSGLKEHTWFLIGIGGIGMIQNFYAAGASREPGAMNVHLKPYKTIVGLRPLGKPEDDPDSDEDDEATKEKHQGGLDHPQQVPIHCNHGTQGEPRGVAGALMALENEIPSAGAALSTIFFPAGMQYDGKSLKFNTEKKFWKAAFRRIGKPVEKRKEGLNHANANGKSAGSK